MAPRTKTPVVPPSPEALDELLRVIRGTDEPMMAKPLAKLLAAPHQIADKQLVPILDGYVTAGVLQRFPSKTAKGQPRYWDRDLGALGRSAVLEAMQRAATPVTASELSKQLVTPVKFTEAELTPILAEFVVTGTVHSIPPATAKGKPRFWNRDVLELGRQAVTKFLETKGPQTPLALRKTVKWLNDVQFEQLFQGLVVSRVLWPHPPLGKVKQELFGTRPPTPEPYLQELGSLLSKVVAKLTMAHVSRDDLRRALVQMIEAAGVSFGATASSRVEPPTVERRIEVDLIALMKQIEPGAERGALISSRDLRHAARLDKPQFDQAVLELSRQGRLALHRHDYVTSLSPAERDELVTDGAGTYYVGMALRQSMR